MPEPTDEAEGFARPFPPDREVTGGLTGTALTGETLASDPRVLQILTAEHSSLANARSLAYNEAFTRAGMFLTSLSMSFVGLALLAQVLATTRDLLVIVAIVVGFDFLIGVLTYIRVGGTGVDDLKAMQGMNRIRQAYVRIAPGAAPFFVTGTNDDVPSVMRSYGYSRPDTGVSALAYGLSTSLGMVGIVMSLVGGVEAAVIAVLVGLESVSVLLTAAVATVLVFAAAARWAFGQVALTWEELEVRFPSAVEDDGSPDGAA